MGIMSVVELSKIVLHEDGTLSFRLGGKWTRRVTEITREDFMKLRSEDREKLWYEGIRRRKDFVQVNKVGVFVWP
jgi:hypothetical protein